YWTSKPQRDHSITSNAATGMLGFEDSAQPTVLNLSSREQLHKFGVQRRRHADATSSAARLTGLLKPAGFSTSTSQPTRSITLSAVLPMTGRDSMLRETAPITSTSAWRAAVAMTSRVR